MRHSSRALLAQAHACLASASSSSSRSAPTVRRLAGSLSPLQMSSSSAPILIPSRCMQTSSTSHAEVASASTATNAASAVSADASDAASTAAAPAKWKPTSRRVGLIAKKVGMTTYFAPDGKRLAATVLRVSDNQVSAHIGFSAPTHDKHGNKIIPRKIEARMAYTAIQVAATNVTSGTSIPKPERGHLKKAGIRAAKRVLHEFKVSRDALVPLGTHLSAAHFVPGQYIDAQAKTRGKGFAGVMKRHGFKGQSASHGTTKTHRSAGSTGGNQDPGRVFPGKKMAGRMGGRMNTMQNLEVLRIDTVNDLVIVQGNIPGPEGAHVYLSDAKKGLVYRAAFAWQQGRLPDHKGMITGKEAAEAFLPNGLIDLPFPAGTRELAKTLPKIIEVGPEPEAEK